MDPNRKMMVKFLGQMEGEGCGWSDCSVTSDVPVLVKKSALSSFYGAGENR